MPRKTTGKETKTAECATKEPTENKRAQEIQEIGEVKKAAPAAVQKPRQKKTPPHSPTKVTEPAKATKPAKRAMAANEQEKQTENVVSAIDPTKPVLFEVFDRQGKRLFMTKYTECIPPPEEQAALKRGGYKLKRTNC